ncbi:hypothetical protein QUE93_07205 [Leuconostoc falkenbergense]|uniref:Uncharacterized protein n=1 Tax=Leuconostoc falkenbergense TaxID=2766470 RepID=A0ABT7RZS0_9LACO|nr:hypothetical protein [Leuconostoc falkenbergense]MDM7646801.1 hypothetical protein [Leuconostoc falkenbergense]
MIFLEFELIGQLVPVTVKTDEYGLKKFHRSLDSRTDYVTFIDENIIINMKNVLTVRIRK